MVKLLIPNLFVPMRRNQGVILICIWVQRPPLVVEKDLVAKVQLDRHDMTCRSTIH